VKAIRKYKADESWDSLSDLAQMRSDLRAGLIAAHHRCAHSNRAWADAVLLILWQVS
jgi:hypothetical protein